MNGYPRERYTAPFKKTPMQLCSPAEFREKICGAHPQPPSLIRPNADEHGNLLSHGRPQGKNGFQYLGFRFDGRQVCVRDSTISRLYRKVALSAKGVARGFANAYPKMNASEILASFNYSDFSQRFSRVHPDELSPDDYGAWTFYSYLKRASETFGERRAPILPQARNFKAIMKKRIAQAMVSAVARRDRAANAAKYLAMSYFQNKGLY